METHTIIWLLVVVPLYQIALAIIMYGILKASIKKSMGKKVDYVCNISATTIAEIVIYDIPATAQNHEVDIIPKGMKVVIKEIRPMIDGRWYYIEMGSQVGYCKGNSLML